MRTVRSCLPIIGTKEETVNFVKFSNSENERELSEIANGTANLQHNFAADQNYSSDCDGDSSHNPRNKISEWQAGWNVTNAIQVS